MLVFDMNFSDIFTTLYLPVCFLFILFLTTPIQTCQGELLNEKFSAAKFKEPRVIHSSREASTVLLDSGQNIQETNYVDLQFDPPFTDFGIQSIGNTVSKRVYILNPAKNNVDVRLNSISGSTQHIHASFFEAKILRGGSNTTFQVVFLPRKSGNVENTLFIDTSQGRFSYQLFGVGHPNPYKLITQHHLVHVNSSYSPLISLFNPYNISLQVKEVYSSSIHLHLQLPNGKESEDSKYWEIPPYETKAVMRASFLAATRPFGNQRGSLNTGENQTAYVSITTKSGPICRTFKVPVDMRVSTKSGVYFALEVLDFGTLRSNDETRVLGVFLLNANTRDVMIDDVKLQKPGGRSTSRSPIDIEFVPIKLHPSKGSYAWVANISFTPDRVNSVEECSGRLAISINNERNNEKIFLPYKAIVLEGTLGWNETATSISLVYPEKKRNKNFNSEEGIEHQNYIIKRKIELMNSFLFPVLVHKLEIAPSKSKSEPLFQIIPHGSGDILLPARNITFCFTISCSVQAARHQMKQLAVTSYTRDIHIFTNVSQFSVPVHLFTNHLQYEIETSAADEDGQILDFSVVAVAQKRIKNLIVHNYNPTPILIEHINTTVPGIRIQLKSSKVNEDDDTGDAEEDLSKVTIDAMSNVTIEVIFSAPAREESYTGLLVIQSSYEVIEIVVRAQVEMGSLTFEPAHLQFPPSFPGKVVQQTLKITSSFAHSTKLESFVSQNKLFFHRKLRNKDSSVTPGRSIKTGKIYFDSRQECKVEGCYTTLPSSTTLGHSWLTSLTLGRSTFETDKKCFTILSNRWNNLLQNNLTRRNTTFELKTSSQQIYNLQATASLYWPLLADSNIYQFPLTMIGKRTHLDVKLHNPSDLFVVVQIMSVSHYPQSGNLTNFLNLTSQIHDDVNFISNDSSVFRIQYADSPPEEDLFWLRYALRLNTDECTGGNSDKCAIIFLNPGETQIVPISYVPKTNHIHSSIILIRNNLTVLETLHVRGTAYNEELKIGSSISGRPKQMLRLQYTKEHLEACTQKGIREPMVTLQKKFIAKNLGPLPLEIHYILIDNSPCEGHGFKIVNCRDLNVLQPNATHEILLRYSPDFTATSVTRYLQVFTGQGSILSFLINVTVPREMLKDCQNSIPRPSWEKNIHVAISFIIISIFFAILLIGLKEANYEWMAIQEYKKLQIPNLLYAMNRGAIIPGIKTPKTMFRTVMDKLHRFITSPPRMPSLSWLSTNMTSLSAIRDQVRRLVRRPRRRKSIPPQLISELAANIQQHDDVVITDGLIPICANGGHDVCTASKSSSSLTNGESNGDVVSANQSKLRQRSTTSSTKKNGGGGGGGGGGKTRRTGGRKGMLMSTTSSGGSSRESSSSSEAKNVNRHKHNNSSASHPTISSSGEKEQLGDGNGDIIMTSLPSKSPSQKISLATTVTKTTRTSNDNGNKSTATKSVSRIPPSGQNNEMEGKKLSVRSMSAESSSDYCAGGRNKSPASDHRQLQRANTEGKQKTIKKQTLDSVDQRSSSENLMTSSKMVAANQACSWRSIISSPSPAVTSSTNSIPLQENMMTSSWSSHTSSTDVCGNNYMKREAGDYGRNEVKTSPMISDLLENKKKFSREVTRPNSSKKTNNEVLTENNNPWKGRPWANDSRFDETARLLRNNLCMSSTSAPTSFNNGNSTAISNSINDTTNQFFSIFSSQHNNDMMRQDDDCHNLITSHNNSDVSSLNTSGMTSHNSSMTSPTAWSYFGPTSTTYNFVEGIDHLNRSHQQHMASTTTTTADNFDRSSFGPICPPLLPTPTRWPTTFAPTSTPSPTTNGNFPTQQPPPGFGSLIQQQPEMDLLGGWNSSQFSTPQLNTTTNSPSPSSPSSSALFGAASAGPQQDASQLWGPLEMETSRELQHELRNQQNNTSSHKIWSVKNAVTMDEDKDLDDPFNLRSIWNQDNHQQ